MQKNIYPPFFKRILFITMSIFLIFQSYKGFTTLTRIESLPITLEILIPFIINLYITGIFAFAGFALPTEKLLPNSYYKIKDSKKLKEWYRKFRIEKFRQFLLVTFWKDKEKQKGFFNGKIDGIDSFETQTRKSEFGHLIPFVIIFVICIWLVIKQLWITALLTMLINVVFNFYPILLQRHHRMRLSRLKKILMAKAKR